MRAASGRALTLDDRARIERMLGQDGNCPSEYRFANLYLYRKRHRYRLLEAPIAHVRGITYDGETHALPLEPLGPGAAALLEDGVDCLFPLGRDAPEAARRLGLACDHVDADSDYWFDGPSMADLSRAKTRRAQARAFEAEQLPVFVPWTQALAAEARTVLDGWMADVARGDDAADARECGEAILRASTLGLEGGLVRTAAGTAVAFLLASRSLEGVSIVHFAKGRRAYSAAYPWMFARYAASSGAAALNFEQDLGNPGLARSKRAYAPIELRPKYRLRRA